MFKDVDCSTQSHDFHAGLHTHIFFELPYMGVCMWLLLSVDAWSYEIDTEVCVRVAG